MTFVDEVDVRTRSVRRFAEVLEPAETSEFFALGPRFADLLEGRAVWHVNTTAVGGGVAEMLRPQIAYTRGAGVDARWLVVNGTPDFFHMTKRLHHALHGMPGDGSPLGEVEREVYEGVMRGAAAEVLARVRRSDLVQLHDPQTLGLAPHLTAAGIPVTWRCHIGTDTQNDQSDLGWTFLKPYLEHVPYFVFSREAYVPDVIDRDRVVIITPTIDAFSPKNWHLDDDTVHTILWHIGLVDSEPPAHPVYTFRRADLSPGRVEHRAEVTRLGVPPSWDTPLVVQVSRWDPLKDPVGLMEGFSRLVERGTAGAAHLVLVGPDVSAVSDDPEGAEVLAATEEAWRHLPPTVQERVHLVSLPTGDVEENAVMVNAIQRHAAVIVQKSLQEGFGLTVTEALWKGRPVVASAVGGIRDQIVHGESGWLLDDPTDPEQLADALEAILADPALAARLGAGAAERARTLFLDSHSFRIQAEWFLKVSGELFGDG